MGKKTLAEILLGHSLPEKKIKIVDRNHNCTELTYGELREFASSVAISIQGIIPKGGRVIISASDTMQFIKAFWSVVLAGGTAVPVTPPLDGIYDEKKQEVIKLRKIVSITEAPLIISGDSEWESIKGVFPEKKVVTLNMISDMAMDSSVPVAEIVPEDNALIVFTSGSTGDPKGVPLSHMNVIAGIESDNSFLKYTDENSFLNWFPLEHVVPLIIFHIMPLMLASEQVHISPVNVLSDITYWIKSLDSFGTNVSWAPNFAYGMLLEAAGRIEEMDISLSRMHEFMSGGEAIQKETSLECMKMLRTKGLRDNALIPIWGMSEVAVGMTFTRKFGENCYKNSVSVGEVTSGYEIRITDKGNVVNVDDTEGNVEVRGKPVFSGYINFNNSLCFTEDGWFKTGDIGVWKNGEIVICGRSAEKFIHNGVNISLQEITNFLQDQLAGQDNRLIAMAYTVKNEDSQQDELVVFLERSTKLSEDELVTFILEKLRIRYSFGVRYIIFLRRDEFPHTSLGKIDKKVLLKRFLDGEYEVRDMLAISERDLGNADELSDEQRMMLYIWADNLGIKPNELGVDDAYFTIGGNSAKSTAMIERINEIFKSDVSAMDFVKHNTINKLLEFIGVGSYESSTENVDEEDNGCEFIVL